MTWYEGTQVLQERTPFVKSSEPEGFACKQCGGASAALLEDVHSVAGRTKYLISTRYGILGIHHESHSVPQKETPGV